VEVYLRAYNRVGDMRASVGRYCSFYNAKRRHQSLDRWTPDSVLPRPRQDGGMTRGGGYRAVQFWGFTAGYG
jgi:hypothetical protein